MGELLAVLVGEIPGQVGLELAVVGMDGGPQGGLGGIALADALQDALNIAHAIGVVDVGHCSQRFGVGDVGFSAGETLEASFQSIEWDIALRFEEQRELMSIATKASGFEELGDTFVQPRRAAAAGKLRNERVSEFMLEHVREFRGHGTETADRDAQLAVIDRSGPRGGVGDIEESLLGVQGYKNIVAGRVAEI